jgi:CRISPR-associated endonuclease/helicase Cas3
LYLHLLRLNNWYSSMLTDEMIDFDGFFHRMTGHLPHPYQKRLAELPVKDRLIRVPTGCGKTAAVIGAWLWRRLKDPEQTPARLVYCLPMRVLVEQTRAVAAEWVQRSETGTQVYTLMGGEIAENWECDPDKPAIFVGTQDLLLSRALNRGYAMSRYRWPVHFGLLNNDCLWVCDEVQLMGNGLGTTTQLQAFRRKWGSYGPAATWWMSATADREWLGTVDYENAAAVELIELEKVDKDGPLAGVCNAAKPIERINALDRKAVESLHRPATLTLVVRNTVGRARELYDSLRGKKASGKGGLSPEVVLIHSRFRPPDRKRNVRRLLAADKALRGEAVEFDEQGAAWLNRVKEAGLIAVSTQVVEAGVDLSAETLITEIAPWPSIVQRLGRCNRGGKQDGSALVRWMPLLERESAPYEMEQLLEARTNLEGLTDGRIANLERFQPFPGEEPTHVIRQHDLHGLFSTEPDLAGGFTDISAYVRDAEGDKSVYVFWREKPGKGEPAPSADEICPVPLNDELRKFLKTHAAAEWNGETERWERRSGNDVHPGMTLLLDRNDGGYSEELGWTGDEKDKPSIAGLPGGAPDAVASDPLSSSDWCLLTSHLRDAEAEARVLVNGTGLAGNPAGRAVILACRWHDLGKNQPRWRDAVPKSGQPGTGPWAKFQSADGEKFRPGIRHEAASALYCFDQWRTGAEGWTGLAVYLVAAHHGKVRTVLRSRRGEVPNVFGIREGDKLPPLPGWLEAEYGLNLDCRIFGAAGKWEDGDGTFRMDSPSWVGMVAEVLGPEAKDDPSPSEAVSKDEPRHLGPFRLAYLEALVVAADVRASRKPGAGGAG